MSRAGLVIFLLLFFWSSVSQPTSAQSPEGQLSAGAPEAKPSTPDPRLQLLELLSISRRQCEGAYASLPTALRIDKDAPPSNEPRLAPAAELALQHAVWDFLCSRRHLQADQDWNDVLDAAKLARDTQRILRASFLKAIVASTYFDVPGYSQIRVEGAIVRGNLSLDREVIRSGVSIRNSTFTGPVNLNYVRIGYNVDFSGSIFCREVNADSMRIDGSLYLGTGDSDVSEVLKHPIACPNSGPLQEDKASQQTTTRQKHQEWDIDALNLSKAEITGELVISTARMRGRADLSEIRIGRRLQVYNSSMDSLALFGANLGRLELVNTEIRNKESSLDAEGISVTHTVYFDRSHFFGNVVMVESEIKSDLSVRGAKFGADLDLSSARISGDLLIGTAHQYTADYARPFTNWSNESRLLLDHAEVGVVRASLMGWPQQPLQAREFRFAGFDTPYPSDPAKDNCGGNLRVTPFGSWFSAGWNSFWDFIDRHTGGSTQTSSSTLGICYYSNWLAKVDFTPSVVSWLQQKLKAVGNQTLADHVGILGKNHERDEAWMSGRYLDWFALALSGLFIGYGYNAWLSGGWAFLFIVVGAVVFKTTSVARRHLHTAPHKAFSSILFSFDMLLPFIQLRKEHHELHIREKFQRYYFYFHKIMGYVLGLFLIGALSGLTK
jgi:hypothetical protein